MSCKTTAASVSLGRPFLGHARNLGFWRRAGDLVLLWIRRYQTRQALRALDLDRLDDIGITRKEARREAAKPFWCA